MVKTTVSFILFVIFSSSILSQNGNWMEYGSDETEDSVVKSGKKNIKTRPKDKVSLDFKKGTEGDVQLNHDKKIEDLIEILATPIPPNNIQLDGFRIQIHFSQDKNQANQERARFMTNFIETPVYLDYLAPNFRVRIGDFRTRIDAEKFKNDLRAIYPGLVIVETRINLPRIKEVSDSESID